MKRTEFWAECQKRLIEPNVAAENEKIRQALRDKDDAKVRELLDTEF